MERDPNEVGALWVKEGKKGEYSTGTVSGVNVICFPIKSDNPRSPAWRVLKSAPKGDHTPRRRPDSVADDPFGEF